MGEGATAAGMALVRLNLGVHLQDGLTGDGSRFNTQSARQESVRRFIVSGKFCAATRNLEVFKEFIIKFEERDDIL